jgi:hypothetical protein
MSRTLNNQRNWKYHQIFKKASDNFNSNKADPVVGVSAMRLFQEDLVKMLVDENFSKEDVIKVSIREGYRRHSKAKLKVRRIDKRSSRQKAMVEIRNTEFDSVDL